MKTTLKEINNSADALTAFAQLRLPIMISWALHKMMKDITPLAQMTKDHIIKIMQDAGGTCEKGDGVWALSGADKVKAYQEAVEEFLATEETLQFEPLTVSIQALVAAANVSGQDVSFPEAQMSRLSPYIQLVD